MDELVTDMGMVGISKSQISRLCAEIGTRVQTFLHRSIEASGRMRRTCKLGGTHHVVSVAVMVSVAVRTDGRAKCST